MDAKVTGNTQRHAYENQLHLVEGAGRVEQRGKGRRTYMAGKASGLRFMSQNKKRATTAGLLAEVYTTMFIFDLLSLPLEGYICIY